LGANISFQAQQESQRHAESRDLLMEGMKVKRPIEGIVLEKTKH